MKFRLCILIVVGCIWSVRGATINFDDDNDKSALKDRHSIILQKYFREFSIPPDVPQVYTPTNQFTLHQKQTTQGAHTTNTDDNGSSAPFDPWSVVWYIGAFGGLVAFFLVVTCSEWCCLKKRPTNSQSQPSELGNPHLQALARNPATATPPPSYHLFAPPSYDAIKYDEKTDLYGVFVVPVHDKPPQYDPAGSVLPT